MKEILVICFCFYSGINLFYFLIFLFDSFFGFSLNDDFIKIQYKVNNQNKKIYIMGAVMHLCKKIKNIDFNKCTNLGAFISMVHIGVVWGLIFGGATLLSLIISIIYTMIVNFKEKNYNLPSDEKFLNNFLKVEIKEYLQKNNGLNELAEYTLDKLWLLDMIVDNMNSSSIIIAKTKEQAKELIRIKMELEPDVDIEKWFEDNGIKCLLQKAKDAENVWSEKFPNILAIS